MRLNPALAFGWRHLLFANWPVDAEQLVPHLPDALSVHEYDGLGWVSITPFVNVNVRPRGLPAWMGTRLPEVNVRTYVTCDGEPGVYFFSLDAQGPFSVLGARLTHYLPYYYARGRFRWADRHGVIVSRRHQPGDRPADFEATYRPDGDPFLADPDSLEAFLTERRRLYTQAPEGSIRFTDIEHDRWTLYPADATIRNNTLFEANTFGPPTTEPELYYSPGVDVVTTRSRQWGRGT